MLMELASKLKENYMVLLPETIPFLAELMEGEFSGFGSDPDLLVQHRLGAAAVLVLLG